jgi:hypothetical protein
MPYVKKDLTFDITSYLQKQCMERPISETQSMFRALITKEHYRMPITTENLIMLITKSTRELFMGETHCFFVCFNMTGIQLPMLAKLCQELSLESLCMRVKKCSL